MKRSGEDTRSVQISTDLVSTARTTGSAISGAFRALLVPPSPHTRLTYMSPILAPRKEPAILAVSMNCLIQETLVSSKRTFLPYPFERHCASEMRGGCRRGVEQQRQAR